MNVNVTLLVQAINFWIIYFVLKRFFFAPFIAIVLQEDEQKNRLTNEIVQEKASIAHVHDEHNIEWHQFRIHCKNNRPQPERIGKVKPTIAIPTVEKVTITPASLDPLIKIMKDRIVNHVKALV